MVNLVLCRFLCSWSSELRYKGFLFFLFVSVTVDINLFCIFGAIVNSTLMIFSHDQYFPSLLVFGLMSTWDFVQIRLGRLRVILLCVCSWWEDIRRRYCREFVRPKYMCVSSFMFLLVISMSKKMCFCCYTS